MDKVFKELAGKKVLVIGLGRSGISTALFLNKIGAKVITNDIKEKDELIDIVKILNLLGIDFFGGHHDEWLLNGVELIIISPGVPADLPLLKTALKKGINIWSEVEFAFRFIDAPIIGVTGTNGKTLTVSVVGDIYKLAKKENIVAGNIGYPLIDVVDRISKNGRIIAEISSFQLEWIEKFKPYIGILLNISSNHLDRHHDLNKYTKTKLRIFSNQTKSDFAILNYDEPLIKSHEKNLISKPIFISNKVVPENGIGIEDDTIFSNIYGRKEICKLSEVPFPHHHITSVLSAIAVSILDNIEIEIALTVIKNYKGLPHRMEYVGEIRGVHVYNDSKATNPQAAIAALKSFENPVILIAGGKDKKMDFSELGREISLRAKTLILIGEASNIISSTVSKKNKNKIYFAKSMADAVEIAFKQSDKEDVILLSPACASFDMFKNYEERGEIFKQEIINANNQSKNY